VAGTAHPERAVPHTPSRNAFCFVNPESVGHPRDSDYRASYRVFDTESRQLTFRRVSYPRRSVAGNNAHRGIVTDRGPSVVGFSLRRLLAPVPAHLRGVFP
jgi:diadenosine tetraphosphatase ApaH/serine/threonine PP2A family protein phosphatase